MNDTFFREGSARQSWLRWSRKLATAARMALLAAASGPVVNGNSGGGPGRRRLRPWRAGAAVAALPVAALLAAGCAGSAGGQQAGLSAYQKALPFAQCMRSHGIANFPDPDSSGNFDTGSIPETPQYDAAQRTCIRLHPYNMVLSQQQQAQEMAQALKYARCMRAHGVPNFPDPTVKNGGISFGSQTNAGSEPSSGHGTAGSGKPGSGHGAGSSGPPESPQYQAANQACQQYAGRGKL